MSTNSHLIPRPEPAPNRYDIDGAVPALVDWNYPDLADHGRGTYIQLCMMHVRAVDDLRIRYDGSRDGWVIEQEVILNTPCPGHELGGASSYRGTGVWREAAFIPAWQFEEDGTKRATGKDASVLEIALKLKS